MTNISQSLPNGSVLRLAAKRGTVRPACDFGFVNVFDNPARQSFISEMVPPDDLPNAVTLSSVSRNLARVFGAAAGGVPTLICGLLARPALTRIDRKAAVRSAG